MPETEADNQSNIIIYQAQDGELSIDVKLDNDTVWLTQDVGNSVRRFSRHTK